MQFLRDLKISYDLKSFKIPRNGNIHKYLYSTRIIKNMGTYYCYILKWSKLFYTLYIFKRIKNKRMGSYISFYLNFTFLYNLIFIKKLFL